MGKITPTQREESNNNSREMETNTKQGLRQKNRGPRRTQKHSQIQGPCICITKHSSTPQKVSFFSILLEQQKQLKKQQKTSKRLKQDWQEII